MDTMMERRLRQEWRTPKNFFDVIRAEFQPAIDVAASDENHLCDVWITESINALSDDTPWLDKEQVAWCNPGFNNMIPWIAKAAHEVDRFGGTVLVLGLVAPSAKWWRSAVTNAQEIRLIGGSRIQFDPPPGIPPSSNSRENALFVIRRKHKKTEAVIWTWDWKQDVIITGIRP